MYNLNDKVAIVTGAGRKNGIGAAIAEELAKNGVQVVVADICASVSDLPHAGNPGWEELTAVANHLSTYNIQAIPLIVDVTDSASIEKMIAEVKAKFGRLDILVNNAGAAVGPSPVLWMAEAAWRRTLEINATGTFLCCKHALPLMIEGEKWGRIINISSLAATKPKPNVSAYAASKAAVVALTQSLAQEVAEYGITTNAILPGDVDTDMKQWGLQLEAWAGGVEKEVVVATAVGKIPLGRLATPTDIAQSVAFLASDQASFITGQILQITGGRELTQ